MMTPSVGPEPMVDEVRATRDQRKYHCMCGKVHVKTGAYVIGVVEAFIVAAQIIFFFAYSHGSLTGLIGTMLWTLAIVFLFLGLKQERAKYLILNLVMQVLQLLGFLILIGVAIYMLVTARKKDYDEEQSWTLFGSLILVAAVLGICFETWFLVVMFKCYRYLQEKQRFAQQMVVIQTGPPPTDAPPHYFSQDFSVPVHLAPPPTYAEVTKPQNPL